MWIIWLIAAGVFFIGEIITVGFLIFWLGIGSLLAMATSFFTDNIVIQTGVFVFSSIALILCTKPLINKYVSQKDTIPTNTYSLIGKKGIVISGIVAPTFIGQVKVGKEVWSATTENEVSLQENTEIEITKIDGVKLVVIPCYQTVSK